MNRFRLSCAVAALLAGSLAAQQIQVIVGFGWVASPVSSHTVNSFNTTSGTSQVFGGLDTQIGTSLTGGHVLANATFQGYVSGGPTVTGGLPLQFDQGIEMYVHGFGGTVTCDLNAEADAGSSGIFQQGSGYRAVANASVSVGCPAYSLTATCRALGVSPPATPPLTMTTPQSGTYMNTDIYDWWVSMDARADTIGSMTGPNGTLILVAACQAYGNVTLL